MQRTYEELARALRHDDPAGAAAHAARQGEGRGRRADRAALDPRAAAQRDLLLARRAQRAHRRAARRAQRAARCGATARAAASSSSGSTGPRCGRCPPSASRTASGRRARVNIDYHVEVDDHYYSVPHALVHEAVEARVDGDDGRDLPPRRSASRRTCAATCAAGTRPIAAHMPTAHQKHPEWTPSRHHRLGARPSAPDDGALVERDPRRAAAPRAGLPLVPRASCGSRKRYGDDAPRGRLRARARASARARTATSSRSSSTGSTALPLPSRRRDADATAGRARERARPRLLPLNEGDDMLNEPTIEKLKALRLDAHGRTPGSSSRRTADVARARLRRALRPARRRRVARAREQAPRARAQGGEAAPRARRASRTSTTRRARELDKAVVRQLATCRWVARAPERRSSPARPAPARPTSPARSRSRPAARATARSTAAPRASSTSSRSPAPTAPTRACSRASRASTCSSSTTAASRRCDDQRAPRPARDPRGPLRHRARRSSPASSRPRSGTTTSATRPSPTRSATASCTTPTASC